MLSVVFWKFRKVKRPQAIKEIDYTRDTGSSAVVAEEAVFMKETRLLFSSSTRKYTDGKM